MDLSDSATLIALGAVALALIDLALAAWFLVWMRRVRRAQRALLAGENVDLVEFAVGMQTRQEQVERASAEVQAALVEAGARIDRCLSHRALVRYDAYVDAGGGSRPRSRCSTIAAAASSCRRSRTARTPGSTSRTSRSGRPADVALSPEEQQAVDAARARPHA